MQKICKELIAVGYKLAWIGYKDSDTGKTVKPVAFAGFEEKYINDLFITWADTERGQGPTGKAIRSGEVSVMRDILNDPNYAPWKEQALKRGYASSISLPIKIDGIYGALNIYSDKPDFFDEEEISLLKRFAENLSFGIKTIRMENELKKKNEELERIINLMVGREMKILELKEENKALIHSAGLQKSKD